MKPHWRCVSSYLSQGLARSIQQLSWSYRLLSWSWCCGGRSSSVLVLTFRPSTASGHFYKTRALIESANSAKAAALSPSGIFHFSWHWRYDIYTIYCHAPEGDNAAADCMCESTVTCDHHTRLLHCRPLGRDSISYKMSYLQCQEKWKIRTRINAKI